jgi:uncharacterized membrane protein YbhN (UPF0104 family)
VLLAVAVLLLRRELDGVGFNGLLTSIRDYKASRIELGIAFTAASFLTLGVFEVLALRYVGKRAERIIPRRTALATSFVASAYSQSVGLAILTGTAVRLRSYSRYGLDALDVARLSVFVTATATLGLLTTGGFAFFTTAGRIFLLGAPRSLAPLGILLLIPIVGYLAWGAFGNSDFYGRGRWRIRRPVLRVALQQIGVSSLDWALAGTVLFVLLPRSLHLSYGDLLGIYLVAQTAAVLSHVPGGLGVFEAVVIGLVAMNVDNRLDPAAVAASVAAALLVYRIIYYLLPFCAAIALSVSAEVIRSRSTAGAPHPTAARTPIPNPLAPDAI